MRVGVKPGVWGWTLAELDAFWVAAEEAGFQHVSVFDQQLAAPPRCAHGMHPRC